MKKYLLFILCILFVETLSAQQKNNRGLAFYSFMQSSGVFSTISTSGIALIPNDWDDGCTPQTNIGFDFNFDGIVSSQFTVNTNGTVNFGSNSFTQATNNIQNPFAVNFLAPLWDDLLFYNLVTNDGIYYQLSGTPGNQILTIEFFQVGRYNVDGTGSEYVNFQVKLYENDSHVEFVYDDLSNASTWHVNSTTSIGLNKTTAKATEYLSLTPANPSATVSSTVPNNIISPTLLGTITSGTTYSFIPPLPVVDFDVALNSINTPTSNFLNANEQISITFSNPGIEITSGLSFSYSIIDLNTGLQLGNTITETYESTGTYPVATQTTLDFSFTTLANLSENSDYEITVSANLLNDIDLTNNTKIANVNGVIIGNLIYENGPIVTQAGVGFDGSDVSQVQNITYGFQDFGPNTTNLIGYRNADQFIVPEGAIWKISGMGFYNWQTGSSSESSINYLDFRILDGNPAIPESNVLFDFSTQNMLNGSKWSGVNRVLENDILNIERPIMLNISNFSEITLNTGTYWVDWTSDGSILSGPYMPYISVLNIPITGDAWHLGTSGWVPLSDGPNTQTQFAQGMPFMIYGSETLSNISEYENKISIYPNPSFGIFNVKTEIGSNILVYNVTGKLIFSKKSSNETESINLSKFSKGIYFVKILNNNKLIVEKIVIY